MALFGLFGGKKKNETPKSDYFLDFEEAQTLGDTELMKKSVTIKRTFPKLKGQGGATVVTQVSSEVARKLNKNQQAVSQATEATKASSEAASTPITPAAPRPNLKVDSSMDMFRNMAKKINR
ncbi:hypothetical protein AWQ21_05060 [Picosynechococcus sp. PCC 7003]|uniref:hypothetical protein n=1 Tax=Picosynechococcus sp. PCC 7003 TaxID=374981 RepID=UPI0008104C0F|nr:hypothetical protein [Picosynechococcus sp. PCC 7003]ANV83804.1 hypothetical protein AWQ21_05060 [Picosynechococcus sp. PCC 7003]